MLRPRPVTGPAPTHEDLFIQRYDWLMGWALRLTRHDREQAEDLVHDAFVQFMLYRPELAAIQNLEAYLYTTLRNLHLAQVRWSTTTQSRALSIAEYDSAEIGLRATDVEDKERAQAALRQICRYAILRKETSKAGSVLLLRFFHGYYPSEIARIIRSPARAVDNWLWIARREAKLFLEDPQRLAFISGQPVTDGDQSSGIQSTEELLGNLRDTIFQANKAACLSVRGLRNLYRNENNQTVDCATLAHVSSCRRCLDEVNKLLDLPLLSDRYPTDKLGPDSRSGEGGSGGPAPKISRIRRTGRRRLQDVIEHKPKELRITVNGGLLGLLSINSELSRLTMRVNTDEKIGFIEVRSEQGLRLLLLNVEPPPDGLAEQTAHVELSEGRCLDVSLLFEDTLPTLHVAYRDPTWTAESSRQRAEGSEALLETDDETSLEHAFAHTEDPTVSLRSVYRKLLSAFRLVPSGFWLRPGVVTTVMAILLVGTALLFIRTRTKVPTPSATDLLYRSSTAEETIAARTDQVTHRTISLEERSPAGELVARRKIEVWHSAEKGITARRVYDEKGYLMAGGWTKADGTRTLYDHGKRPQIQSPSAQTSALTIENVWQLELSAKYFTSLIGSVETANVEERPNSYTVNYKSVTAASGLVSATLVLSKADLHPIEQRLLIQQGGEQHEYRFVETSFERRPLDAVPPKVFEPEPELLGTDAGTWRHGDTGNVPASPRLPVPASRAVATADLEVEVMRLLNQAGADMGEQISVTRTSDGELRVEGIVETEKRKAEILNALSSLSDNPAVKVEINTVAEALARQQRNRAASSSATVREIQITKDLIPAGPELRKHFGKQGEQADEEVRRFAARMITRSRRAMSHAGAMKRLINQFSAEDLRSLTPEAHVKWLTLIRGHARAFEQETQELRQELQPIFSSVALADGGKSELGIVDDKDLTRAVEQLFEIGTAYNEVIRSSFTASTSEATTTAIKTPQFWYALREAESLAQKIARSQ